MADSTNELFQAVGRLEGKMDTFIQLVGNHTEKQDLLEKRVNVLEAGRAWLIGASAASGLFASVALKLFL